MVILNKILTTILYLLVWCIFIVLPSIDVPSFMNSTQSGKTFVFLYLILILCSILLLQVLFIKRLRFLRISIPDIFLSVFCLFVVVNALLNNGHSSLRFFEFVGLIVLYVVIRQMQRDYLGWLYAALIVGCGIQALYGNLQLWGYYPSHHGLFKMTGSFFNPGPYAGYLASVFPVTLGFYLLKIDFPVFGWTLQMNMVFRRTLNIFHHMRKSLDYRLTHFRTNTNSLVPSAEKRESTKSKKKTEFAGVFILSVLILIALVLPASRSRAAWMAILVSSVYLLFVRYNKSIKILLHRFLDSSVKKLGAIILSIILSACFVSGLYFLKKGSADGRLLIWKVNCNMIKDKPVFGSGFDQFKAHYMDYQAAFFEQNPDSEEAMVAGDTNYAFNELLQQTVENGIVGLVLLLVVLGSVFIVSDYKFQVTSFRLQVLGYRLQVFTPALTDSGWERQILWIARAGIISIIVFALFSYPVQILPIKMSMVLYLATIASLVPQKEIAISGNNNRTNSGFFIYTARILFSCLIFLLAFAGFIFIKTHTNAFRDWNSAYQLYQLGAYDACLEDYEKAYPVLKNNGDFLTNYGKALSMAEKHAEAIDILQQAEKYYPNTVVYTALGDSYKKLNKTKQAEQAYLHAWYMNPSRFYPKYLLAKLYDESGQKEKAIAMAEELLNKEIKIQSTAIKEIRDEMNEIITKYKEGN